MLIQINFYTTFVENGVVEMEMKMC